jgi:KamA family protein
MATTAPRLQFFGLKNFDQLPQMALVSPEHRAAMKVVAHVLPFRVNNYVVNELINWNNVPDDPIFQLTFPQPGMLSPTHFGEMAQVLASGSSHEEVMLKANEIREQLNPHPEGQMQYNVPKLDGDSVPGIQHKYRETCLVFPSAGQTCHAYCTFCFRWAQFVGMDGLKFATDEAMRFADYLGKHKEITDVLFTGGDPMVMKTEMLSRYIEPLLAPEYDHIRTIRIGTKSLSYWPYRYLSDKDSDDLIRLLERVVASGKHLAIMAHFNHHQEMQTDALRKAVARLRAAGATIRTQSPLIRHINDDARVWSTMWQQQVYMGMIPYYMFVERETGAKPYFQLPLSRAVEIYRNAMNQVSGLARTARGPVMSALPGKVCVEGVAEIGGKRVFCLNFLQARDASWCKQPFFAEFNAEAHWLNDLRPAFGEKSFFYEADLKQLLNRLGGEKPVATPVGHELSVIGEPVAAA